MTQNSQPDAPANSIDTSGIDEIIGYRLRRAQSHVFNQFKTRFDPLGLTPADYSTLVLINHNPGRKPSELAEALGVQRTNFVPLISGLEQRGWVVRKKSAADGRSFALHLTPDGAQLLQTAQRVQAEFETRCIADLGGELARDALLALLGQLDHDQGSTK